jgi:Flp pilus assembly pilin Flp
MDCLQHNVGWQHDNNFSEPGRGDAPPPNLCESLILQTIVNFSLPGFRSYTILMMERAKHFLRDEHGQDLIEYTLLMAFVALASATIFVNAGKSVKGIWDVASNQLSNAAVAAS